MEVDKLMEILKNLSSPTEADVYFDSAELKSVIKQWIIDQTTNAPMIPRKEVIAILNELQLMQTRLLIILNQHEPEHFKETQARQPKVAQPEWSSTGTGHTEQSMVHTLTRE